MVRYDMAIEKDMSKFENILDKIWSFRFHAYVIWFKSKLSLFEVGKIIMVSLNMYLNIVRIKSKL